MTKAVTLQTLARRPAPAEHTRVCVLPGNKRLRSTGSTGKYGFDSTYTNNKIFTFFHEFSLKTTSVSGIEAFELLELRRRSVQASSTTL